MTLLSFTKFRDFITITGGMIPVTLRSISLWIVFVQSGLKGALMVCSNQGLTHAGIWPSSELWEQYIGQLNLLGGFTPVWRTSWRTAFLQTCRFCHFLQYTSQLIIFLCASLNAAEFYRASSLNEISKFCGKSVLFAEKIQFLQLYFTI